MARKKRKRVASRGSVNNIILKTLVNGDKYGYEIIKEVEEFSNGKIKLKQPSLYSSLSRFEDKNYVTSYWCDSDMGGRRHYYHLTELGFEYYRKAVLKESDNDAIEVDEEELEEIMSENLSSSTQENNEDAMLECCDVAEDEEDDHEDQILELTEDDIPAIVNFEQKTEETPIIIPDHNYYKTTPLDEMINKSEATKNDSSNIEETSIFTSTTNDNVYTVVENNPDDENDNKHTWQELAELVKQSNSRFAKTNKTTLYSKKPKKGQKIILDRDGIYKLRDEDYIPVSNIAKSSIIDNVGKRTSPTNVYGYASYTDNKKEIKKDISELTDEEKKLRNDNFLAKFNLLTNAKMKPISTTIYNKVEEKKQEPPIDYRGKLNAVIEKNIADNEEDPFVEIEEVNNIYNYTDTAWNTTQQSSNVEGNNLEQTNNSYVALEPTEQFETKIDDKQYIDEINNYSSSNEIKINKYENKAKAILVDKTYVLINKLRFVFGIILSLIMTAELTTTYLILKNNNLIIHGDGKLFILASVFILVFAGFYIIPYFINNNQHKANNFKFKYAIWFGILTFLVLSILIYCINALAGFELDNFNYFAVKIIVPAVLSINFVIAPIIYGILIEKRSFYD